MRRYKQLFIESHIKTDKIKDVIVDIYVNPKRITTMMDWMRGVIDKDGNLYVCDHNESIDIYDYPIHADITEWLDKNVSKFNSHGYRRGDDPLNYIEHFVLVDRINDTLSFTPSENYEVGYFEAYEALFTSFFTLAKKKNSKYWFGIL